MDAFLDGWELLKPPSCVLVFWTAESYLLGLCVSTGSLFFFYFVISPLYYVLSSHKGGDSPNPE